jgi:hypothetical protein
MKNVSVLMLFIASLFTNLFAQHADTSNFESQDILFEYVPNLDIDTCYAPTNLVNAVVYTNRKALAYLEFKSVSPLDQVSIFDASSNLWFGDFNIDKGQLSLSNLETNKNYQLFTRNSCGEEVMIAVIDTKIEKKSPLTISPILFSELTNYVNERSPSPLTDFLANNQKISYLERLSYFQQHLMQGQPFDEFPNENSFPLISEEDSRSVTCNCTFVLNTVEFIAPGTQVLTIQNSTTRQGNINSVGTCSNNNNWGNPKVEYNDDSEYWWYRGEEGPAKYFQMWSEGDNAGGDERTTVIDDTDQNGTSLSGYYAMLQYSFFCTNAANVPEGCACSNKPINFDWRYDTKVTAWANKGSAILSKNAAAAAQDVAVVTYQELGGLTAGLEVLGAGTRLVQAQCDRNINSAFWLTAAELAGNIAVIVAAANGNIPLTANQITALAATLGQLTTSPTTSTGCNVEATSSNVLTAGNTTDTKFLKPNTPVRVICSSFSNLAVLGKRSWLSWARIHSSFKISGVVKGGLIGHDEDYCCTKTVGNWVAASNEDPNRLTEFLQLVGLHFSSFFFGLPTFPSGAILIQNEFGFMTQEVHPGCNGIHINPTHRFDGDDANLNSMDNSVVESSFEIYDLMGRLHFKGKALNLSKSNMSQFIMENNLVATPGMYVVSLYHQKSRESWKIFLN